MTSPPATLDFPYATSPPLPPLPHTRPATATTASLDLSDLSPSERAAFLACVEGIGEVFHALPNPSRRRVAAHLGRLYVKLAG